MKQIIGVALLSLGLIACQPTPSAPEIRVENAKFRAPLPGQTTAVAYFDIVNTGGKDTLVSASSNISERVELHDHLHEDGKMKMRKVENVPVNADSITSFKSGGLHIMLFQAEIVDPVTLTLDFETHEDVTVKLEPVAN